MKKRIRLIALLMAVLITLSGCSYVKFENEVGRRDTHSIPGNADPSLGEFETSLAEKDQSATEIITLTPPTGANLGNVMMLQILAAVLVALVILAIGIVIIKKKVLTK